MRRILAAAVAGILATASTAPAEAQAPGRPNVVVIMADDMGFSDIGCYGSEISTPNLDRLAAGGVKFTQFYNTARCCPSRASLLTGLYAHQAGVGNMINDLGTPAYQGYLADTCATTAEVLGDAGYHTLMAGKWHVGEKPPHWPTDRGFQRYFGLISGASSYFAPERTMAQDGQPLQGLPADYYATDAFGGKAAEFIEAARKKDPGQPFYLYLAFTAPHWPLHAKPADIARYRGKYKGGWDALRAARHKRQIELGMVDANWKLAPRDARAPAWDTLTPAEQDQYDLKMSVYAAQIDSMDQNIGKVLDKIRDVGAADNTLVMFLADNGACAENPQRPGKKGAIGTDESFAAYGLPWANVSNVPFRRFKVEVHEGGISSPLVASWPGKIKPGTVVKDAAHIIDVMPTVLEAAGATYPAERGGKKITPCEGRSLLPAMRGEKWAGHEALYWEHSGNRAVRQGEWKLVCGKGAAWELYNITSDRGETRDLAAEMPDRVQRMSALYDAWAQKVGARDFAGVPKKGK